MAENDPKEPSPERDQTDEGLRIERENTDRALIEKQAVVEEDADQVLQRARDNADAVLTEAREKADQRLEIEAPGAPLEAISEERTVEDASLRDERASADEILRRERKETARSVHTLLPLERERTDEYLLTERERSDEVVSNRDDFLGIVSHDLRNLLGGIVLSAELLARRAAKSEEQKGTVQETGRIKRYAERMDRLIGDLLDVASIDAGKLAVSPLPGDVTALITEAVDTFHAIAADKGIVLEARAAKERLLADFDHDRLLQVLTNLINNAIKFTPRGGKIEVSCERTEETLRLCVRDTGSGIPEKLLEAIFERFSQAAANDRRGLGLGLYISRCIVEAHRGKIWAESDGTGSRVCFTLPSAAKA